MATAPAVVQQPMTSTDRLVAGVIAALFAPVARLYEMNAAFGAVIVCAAFANDHGGDDGDNSSHEDDSRS